jgi:hypothetical protein
MYIFEVGLGEVKEKRATQDHPPPLPIFVYSPFLVQPPLASLSRCAQGRPAIHYCFVSLLFFIFILLFFFI